MQRRHGSHLVARRRETLMNAGAAEVEPAPAGDPGDVRGDIAVARGHPRWRHRVEHVDDQSQDREGQVAAHVAHPRGSVADPQHRGDDECCEEVGVVHRGEHDVVPMRRHRSLARHAAQVLLEERGGKRPAEEPAVGGDRLGHVHRHAELVGQASAVQVHGEQRQRRPPVPQEGDVGPQRSANVPGDDSQPDPGDRGDRLLGQPDRGDVPGRAPRRTQQRGTCTRRDVATRALVIAGAPAPVSSSPPFPSVATLAWRAEQVRRHYARARAALE